MYLRKPLFKVPRPGRKAAAVHNSTAPLLKLPAEIRNRIYELVIPHDELIIIGARHEWVTSRRRFGPQYVRYAPPGPTFDLHLVHNAPPALAQTSQLLRRDVMPMYYGNNSVRYETDDEYIWDGCDVWQHLKNLQLWIEHVKRQGLLKYGGKIEVRLDNVRHTCRWWRPDTYYISLKMTFENGSCHAQFLAASVLPHSGGHRFIRDPSERRATNKILTKIFFDWQAGLSILKREFRERSIRFGENGSLWD